MPFVLNFFPSGVVLQHAFLLLQALFPKGDWKLRWSARLALLEVVKPLNKPLLFWVLPRKHRRQSAARGSCNVNPPYLGWNSELTGFGFVKSLIFSTLGFFGVCHHFQTDQQKSLQLKRQSESRSIGEEVDGLAEIWQLGGMVSLYTESSKVISIFSLVNPAFGESTCFLWANQSHNYIFP